MNIHQENSALRKSTALLSIVVSMLISLILIHPVHASDYLSEEEIKTIAINYFAQLGLTAEEMSAYHPDAPKLEKWEFATEVEWTAEFCADDYVWNEYMFTIDGATGAVTFDNSPSPIDPAYAWKRSVSIKDSNIDGSFMDRESVIARAQEYFDLIDSTVDGMTVQQRAKYRLSENVSIAYETIDHVPVWCVQYTDDDYQRGRVKERYKFYINGVTGELMDFEHPVLPNPINQWYAERCLERNNDFVFWTVEQKYEYKLLYTDIQNKYYDTAMWYNICEPDQHLIFLSLYDYQLPDTDCISQKEAGEKAFQYLIANTNSDITAEYITQNYCISYSFLNSTMFDKAGHLSWKVFFIPIDRMGFMSPQWRGPRTGYFVEVDAYTGYFLGIQQLDYISVDYIE